jgi:hypothetical protein
VGVKPVDAVSSLDRRENRPEGPAGPKVVWDSLDSRGGIVLRGWRGRHVPLATMSWYPGATPGLLRDALAEQKRSYEVSGCDNTPSRYQKLT